MEGDSNLLESWKSILDADTPNIKQKKMAQVRDKGMVFSKKLINFPKFEPSKWHLVRKRDLKYIIKVIVKARMSM